MGFAIELLPALADNYTYLISDHDLGLAMVVDPGDADVVRRVLHKKDLHLALVLNTHHHTDHVAGNLKLQQEYGAAIVGPDKEKLKIEGVTRGVSQGHVVTFSDLRGQVIDTPGHTSGSVSYYFPQIKALFCGDTLFSLGCGRLYEGSASEMWSSLCKLRDLPDDTMIYAGHEYTEKNAQFALMLDKNNETLKSRITEVIALRKKGQSTLPVRMDLEKRTNPFLRVDDPAFQKTLRKSGFAIEDADAAAIFGAMRAAKDRLTAEAK